MDIPAMADAVESREDLARFLHALSEEARKSGHEWENPDLASYFEGASGWTRDMGGAFKNRGHPTPAEPSWKLFAQILMAACQYE